MHWSVIGASLLSVAVLVGAFGAHALRERLDEYARGIYERAVFYHFVHSLGLIALGIAATSGAAAGSAVTVAGWGLLSGLVVFCGSLYALALSGNRALGAITPLGGAAFIVGWIGFAVALGSGHA